MLAYRHFYAETEKEHWGVNVFRIEAYHVLKRIDRYLRINPGTDVSDLFEEEVDDEIFPFSRRVRRMIKHLEVVIDGRTGARPAGSYWANGGFFTGGAFHAGALSLQQDQVLRLLVPHGFDQSNSLTILVDEQIHTSEVEILRRVGKLKPITDVEPVVVSLTGDRLKFVRYGAERSIVTSHMFANS